MKHLSKLLNTKLLASVAALTLVSASCKKDNPTPPAPNNDEEVITTFQFKITDSASNVTSTYFFKDPDGDGGQAPYYGPTAATQSDSVLQLQNNHTYFVHVLLMDETKTPIDTTSNEVYSEGHDHMLFYNNGGNTITNAGNPYTVKLNGSDLEIKYLDLDAGSPQRGIGLSTRWRTYNTGKYPLNVTLRHQPGVKDGSFGPGDSDISVNFKYQVQ